MTPDRMEFRIGQTRFEQTVRLVLERGSDGVQSWSIYRDQANQRDTASVISGLSKLDILKMADAVKSWGK